MYVVVAGIGGFGTGAKMADSLAVLSTTLFSPTFLWPDIHIIVISSL